MIDLTTRRSAAEVTFQPGDPVWHRTIVRIYGWSGDKLTAGEFRSYGAVRCIVELARTNAPRIITADPANVFPRLDDDPPLPVQPLTRNPPDRRRKGAKDGD